MMAAFWVVTVLLVFWAARGSRRDDLDRAGRSGAERTLDERFARGEIDADEYEARRKVRNHRA